MVEMLPVRTRGAALELVLDASRGAELDRGVGVGRADGRELRHREGDAALDALGAAGREGLREAALDHGLLRGRERVERRHTSGGCGGRAQE